MGRGLVLLLLTSFNLLAADVPGGHARTAEIVTPNTFEFRLSPTYLISPSGAYLTTEVRYQPSEDFGTGLSFGAGEVGYNFGLNGTWYIFPDTKSQPGFSLLGGLYFNRIEFQSFFVFRLAPTLSKVFKMSWGQLVPYAGMPLSPSFHLGGGANEFSVKSVAGLSAELKSFGAVRLWTEVGIGVVKSFHEILIGLSCPFSTLGG